MKYPIYQSISGTTGAGTTSVWVPEPEIDATWIVYKALEASQEARDTLVNEIQSLITLIIVSLEMDSHKIKITWHSGSKNPFFQLPTVAEILARFGDEEEAYLGVTAAAEAAAVRYLVLDMVQRWDKQLKWIAPFVLAHTTFRMNSI